MARRLFVEQGFHQTGVAQIAAESGIKVGQIYRDFASKEAVIAAICQGDVAAWLEEDVLAAAVRSGDLSAIRQWLTRFDKSEDSDEHSLMPEIIAEAGRNPRIADLFRAMDERVLEQLCGALAAIAPSNMSHEEIEAVADLILTLGIGLTSRRIVRNAPRLHAVSRLINRLITGDMRPICDTKGSDDSRRSQS